MMLFTCVIIAYIINIMGDILLQINKYSQHYNNEVTTINQFFNKK